MFLKIKKTAVANQSGAMETRDHSTCASRSASKNGASSKSQMSRGNFLRKACFAVLAAGVIFGGCGKDDDKDSSGEISGKKITIKIENGDQYSNDIEKIKIMTGIGEEYVELASADYNKGNVTFTLPDKLDDKYLDKIGDELPSTITISNKNAKFGGLEFQAYIIGSIVYDKIIYGKVINKSKRLEASGSLMYADSDVSFTGTGTFTNTYEGITYEGIATYSLNLKKGWNFVYMIGEDYTETATKITSKIKITTSDPGGLKWYLEKDFKALFW